MQVRNGKSTSWQKVDKYQYYSSNWSIFLVAVRYLIIQVPLGIHLLNENKVDEMCMIMNSLHKYVPKATHQITNQDNRPISEEFFHEVLFGGDQLTACRSRAAQTARCNDDNPVERLEGLIPVVEDWHARLTLTRVGCIMLHVLNFVAYIGLLSSYAFSVCMA